MKDRTTYIDKSLLVSPSDRKADAWVRGFQRKLYIRAKQDKGFKAHSLRDKVNLDYVLVESYRRVRQNYSKGTGVDGIRFMDIERYGVHRYLSELQTELVTGTYRCSPVRLVKIPKEKKGEFRTLGIPTIRDRIVQMAVKMLIEPLWEADFVPTSYGFRPKRSAKDATRQVKKNIKEGYGHIYDADLSKYFDTIPHNKLFILLKQRIADKGILDLIGQWLKAPKRDENGKLYKSDRGTPQGGVISPLLSNIYLHAFDRIVANPNGKFGKEGIRIVRYADDFLLMGKGEFSQQILSYLNSLMSRMGLSLNKEKSRQLHIAKDGLKFLGFEYRVIRSRIYWSKGKYLDIRPSHKSRSKLFRIIRDELKTRGHWNIESMIKRLNEKLRGWLEYFTIPKTTYIWETVKVIERYLNYRLWKWLKGKGRRAHKSFRRRPYDSLVKSGLIDIRAYARSNTLAKAE